MIQSISQIVQQHKKFILLLVVLVILPLIGIAAFPYFMYLTVPPRIGFLCMRLLNRRPWMARLSILMIRTLRTTPPCLKKYYGGEVNTTNRDPPYSKGDLRQVGEVEYPPEKITQWTIDRYVFDNTTGERKYFEYNGSYYRIGTLYAD